MPLIDEEDKKNQPGMQQPAQPQQQPMQQQAAPQQQQQPGQMQPAVGKPPVVGQRQYQTGPVKQPRGTGFMGVRRVLGASQGARVGQAVTGRLQEAGELARTGLGQARQQFQTEAGQVAQTMGSQAELARGALAGIAGGTGAVAGPTAEQQAAFQTLASGQYKGPIGLAGAEDLATKTMQAQRLGELAGTQAGRQELLRQQFAQRGGYGAKQSALDALILGKTAGRELAQARTGLTGLEKELTTEQKAAAEQARGLKEKTAGLGRELLGGIEREVGELGRTVSEKQKALSEQQKSEYDRLTKALRTGEVEEGDTRTLELLKQAGIEEGSFLGGLSEADISQYVQKATAPELKSVISPEQLARMQALQKLGGTVAEGKLAPVTSAYTGAKMEEAGKYDPTKAVGFAKTKEGATQPDLQSVLADRKTSTQEKFTQTKQIEDANQAVADLLEKYGALPQLLNHGQKNFLASQGIYVINKPYGGGVWGKGPPREQAGDFGPEETIHPLEMSKQATSTAQEARTQRQAFESTLGKTLKIKKK